VAVLMLVVGVLLRVLDAVRHAAASPSSVLGPVGRLTNVGGSKYPEAFDPSLTESSPSEAV
jgi:hypothetical protein